MFNVKIENDKIVEATEDELYDYWLTRWSELYSFSSYLKMMKDKGVQVIK